MKNKQLEELLGLIPSSPETTELKSYLELFADEHERVKAELFVEKKKNNLQAKY